MYAIEGTIQGSVYPAPVPPFAPARAVVSFDKQSATVGTVDITYKARGMADAHTPADNQFDVTGTQRQFELIGGDVGSVILTPAGLDSAVKYRIAYHAVL